MTGISEKVAHALVLNRQTDRQEEDEMGNKQKRHKQIDAADFWPFILFYITYI